MKVMGKVQQLGKALMLPIAVMPAAALLLSFSVLLQQLAEEFVAEESFLFHITDVMAAGAGGILGNISLLFAIGVAVGLTRGSGVAALAGAVGYLVLQSILAVPAAAELDTGVLGGILSGLITAYLYRKYHDVRFPDWLQFFGGKRFVPIITSFVMFIVGILFLFIWPPIQAGIKYGGEFVIGLGSDRCFWFWFSKSTTCSLLGCIILSIQLLGKLWGNLPQQGEILFTGICNAFLMGIHQRESLWQAFSRL